MWLNTKCLVFKDVTGQMNSNILYGVLVSKSLKNKVDLFS